MSLSSLRLRLLAAGTAAVLVSLAVAALGLGLLFERHVRRLAIAELSFDLDQLAAALARGPGGTVVLRRTPTDPRFDQPLSGRYWQVETEGAVHRSRSLWDGQLALPPPPPDGSPREIEVVGPHSTTLLVQQRALRLGTRTARAAVAIDLSELRAASRSFMGDAVPYFLLLAAVLIAAGWVQVTVGLRPLARVGSRVAEVRSGAAPRLGQDFPDEVQPLAAEVDALIAAREEETARARARAADLAHGLKTPLQALVGEADRLRAAGAAPAADGLDEIASAMGRHIDRELARARIALASPGVACDPALVATRLLGVLRRTGAGERLAWQTEFAPGLRLRIDADDLTEALGAVLENAARHARSAVTVTAAAATPPGRAAILIRDDGPGIPEEYLETLTERGLRLDQADFAPGGTGLGLAIAREITEAAGGTLSLHNRNPGLEVRLEFSLAAPRRNLTSS